MARKRNGPNEHNRGGAKQNRASGDDVPIAEHRPDERRDTECRDESNKNDGEHWEKQLAQSAYKLSKTALIFDGIVAFFAAVGAGFIFVELREMHESNRLNMAGLTQERERFILSQRAFVGISGIQRSDTSNMIGPVIVTLAIKNFGHVPAVDTSAYWAYQFRKLPLPTDFIIPLEGAEKVSSAVLSPGQSLDVPVNVKAPTQEEVATIHSNGLHLYVYGLINYRDVLGTYGKTIFCVFLDGTNVWTACQTQNTFLDLESKHGEENEGKTQAE